MSTPTTSTLSSTPTLSQSGNGMPVAEAKQLAQKMPASNTTGINGGFNVPPPIPVPVAQYVHALELDGDRGGDTRVTVSDKFSTEFAKNAPGPRDQVRQSQVMSSKLASGPMPESVTGCSEASNT